MNEYDYLNNSPSFFDIFGIGWIIFFVVVGVVMIAAYWKIYEKAGEPGWACLVPIYNIFVLLRIVGRPGWWLILFFIPCVNIVIEIIVYIDLARAFGKSSAWVLGMIFLPFVFFPILGFGDAEYVG